MPNDGLGRNGKLFFEINDLAIWFGAAPKLALHALTVDRMNVVNKVNVVNMWKSAMFTT
jgi:hypothetical protein